MRMGAGVGWRGCRGLVGAVQMRARGKTLACAGGDGGITSSVIPGLKELKA